MAGCEFDDGTVEIRRSMSTAKVKGEAMQEKVRWFDPKTKQGKKKIPIPPQLIATLREWKEKKGNGKRNALKAV